MFQVTAVQQCAYSQTTISSVEDNAPLNKPRIKPPMKTTKPQVAIQPSTFSVRKTHCRTVRYTSVLTDFGQISWPNYGGSEHFWNVSEYPPDYTAQRPRTCLHNRRRENPDISRYSVVLVISASNRHQHNLCIVFILIYGCIKHEEILSTPLRFTIYRHITHNYNVI
jgi:hypothetical protein